MPIPIHVVPNTDSLAFDNFKTPNFFKYEILYIERSTEGQLWSLLDKVGEVSWYRKHLLIQNHVPQSKINECSQIVQSFIKQAKKYWKSAKMINNPSNALLYYYAFLNLVKAFLALHNRLEATTDVNHGLHTSHNNFDSGAMLCKTVLLSGFSPRNVYANYSQEIFDYNYLNNRKLKIRLKDLLKYCESIEFENRTTTGNDLNISPLKVICDHKSVNEYRIAFAVKGDFQLPDTIDIRKYVRLFSCYKYRHIATRIEKAFPSVHSANIDLYLGQNFEPALEDPKLREFFDCFNPFIGPTYMSDNSTGRIYLPIKSKNNITTEILPIMPDQAIYLFMFFLSEMVRYRPYYLDALNNKKDYWLFKNFLDNCPIQFLKAITNRILNQNFILTN